MQLLKRLVSTGYLSVWLFACATTPHGESEKGPHGGYVKMPGEFHVEVVPKSPSEMSVYLLDLASQSPLTIASKLKGTIQQNGKTGDFSCAQVEDHYFCRLPEGTDLNEGQLTLYTVRKEKVGRPVTFPLPLRLPG